MAEEPQALGMVKSPVGAQSRYGRPGFRMAHGLLVVAVPATDVVTPPFAGYVSGHSTYSRAAAEVLAHATGSAYFPGGLGIRSGQQPRV